MSEICKEAAQPWEDAGAGKLHQAHPVPVNLPQTWLPERAGGNLWSPRGEGTLWPRNLGRGHGICLGRLEIQAGRARHFPSPFHRATRCCLATEPSPAGTRADATKPQLPTTTRAAPSAPSLSPQTGTHLTGNTMSWREEAPGRSLPASPCSKHAVHPPVPSLLLHPAPSDT